MNVPFNSDYKHIVMFDSVTDQTKAFKTRANNNGYHVENLNIIVKNGDFIIKGRWDKFNECNYMMWRYKDDYGTDNDHTSKWYYSFIDDVQYTTRLGTKIKHTIDVWQTYHIGAHYHKCYIERAHIPLNEDIIGNYVAPEPVGFGGEYETITDIFNLTDLAPEIIVESISLPNVETFYGTGDASNKFLIGADFQYGGKRHNQHEMTSTGIYRCYPNFPTYSINRLLEIWAMRELNGYKALKEGGNDINESVLEDCLLQTTNHLEDIIKICFLPKFVIDYVVTQGYVDDVRTYISGSSFTNVGKVIDKVTTARTSRDVNITNNHLGCFKIVNNETKYYEPHNKKMFTSLARAFKIINRNGLSVPLRPELFNNIANLNSVNISLEMSSYGNIMCLKILNYNDLTHNNIMIPYNYSLFYGINSNTGTVLNTKMIAYEMDKFDARLGYVQKGIGIATEVAGSAMGLSQGLGTTQVEGSLYNQNSVNAIRSQFPNAKISSYDEQFGVTNPKMAAGGAALGVKAISDSFQLGRDIVSTEFNLELERSNAYQSQTLSIGNANGDLMEMTQDYIGLQFVECNPTYKECEIIDDFLDIYGYSIMEHRNLGSMLNTRTYWNYVKTKNCVINIDAPNADTVVFNSIFNAGTTIWHDINNVGNYNLHNWE